MVVVVVDGEVDDEVLLERRTTLGRVRRQIRAGAFAAFRFGSFLGSLTAITTEGEGPPTRTGAGSQSSESKEAQDSNARVSD